MKGYKKIVFHIKFGIRRDVWDQIKFDNNVDNIEDRIWAEAILKKILKSNILQKHRSITTMEYINPEILKDLKV